MWILATGLLRGAPFFLRLPEPLPLRAIALVAPAGAFFEAESLRHIDASVTIHRFGDDMVRPYPYHAEHVRSLLNVETDDYHVHTGVGHHAFIDARLEDDRAIMRDPEGFDRTAFIAGIN